MKIELGDKKYTLSDAQSRVLFILKTEPNSYVSPSHYHNHQTIIGNGRFREQFKKPTLKWLKDREILIPNGNRDQLHLNEKVRISQP